VCIPGQDVTRELLIGLLPACMPHRLTAAEIMTMFYSYCLINKEPRAEGVPPPTNPATYFSVPPALPVAERPNVTASAEKIDIPAAPAASITPAHERLVPQQHADDAIREPTRPTEVQPGYQNGTAPMTLDQPQPLPSSSDPTPLQASHVQVQANDAEGLVGKHASSLPGDDDDFAAKRPRSEPDAPTCQ
jgi:hypothetical protein